jgi:hypothetical protein
VKAIRIELKLSVDILKFDDRAQAIELADELLDEWLRRVMADVMAKLGDDVQAVVGGRAEATEIEAPVL